jgi:uncharacterized repeat protein (TIGR01451 family)
MRAKSSYRCTAWIVCATVIVLAAFLSTPAYAFLNRCEVGPPGGPFVTHSFFDPQPGRWVEGPPVVLGPGDVRLIQCFTTPERNITLELIGTRLLDATYDEDDSAPFKCGPAARCAILQISCDATLGELVGRLGTDEEKTDTLEVCSGACRPLNRWFCTGGVAGPALVVRMEANPNTIEVGGEITYRIRITNLGPSDAEDVRMTTGLIPDAARFVSASHGCELDQVEFSRFQFGALVRCVIGDMEDGETQVRLIVLRAVGGGTIHYSVSVDRAGRIVPAPRRGDEDDETVTTVRGPTPGRIRLGPREPRQPGEERNHQ